jgi:hypothetical protein
MFDASLYSYPFLASAVEHRTYMFGAVVEEGLGYLSSDLHDYMRIPAALGRIQIVESHTLGAQAETDLKRSVADTKAIRRNVLGKGGSWIFV